jgi:hypothetical protein
MTKQSHTPGLWTQATIEALGYKFTRNTHYGQTRDVSISRADNGCTVCTHFHTQGAIDAFAAIRPGQHGRMTEAEETRAVTASPHTA